MSDDRKKKREDDVRVFNPSFSDRNIYQEAENCKRHLEWCKANMKKWRMS